MEESTDQLVQSSSTIHPRPSSPGIDVQQALSILSARSDFSENQPHVTGCGCCNGSEVPENVKAMGQTIDMLAASNLQGGPVSAKQSEEERDQEQQRLQEKRKERQAKILSQLKSMSTKELLQAVLDAQQDRVATYRDYENGLVTVLQSGNMTSYPDTCSRVTASFSVLSETIKTISEILNSQHQRKDLSKLITQLQSREKEKLHLTAAIHLERIREKNEQLQAAQDPRIANLLRDGVQSLQLKIQEVVEQVNEVLDEIRCYILDEE